MMLTKLKKDLGAGLGLEVGRHPKPGWRGQRVLSAELSATARCARKTLFCASVCIWRLSSEMRRPYELARATVYAIRMLEISRRGTAKAWVPRKKRKFWAICGSLQIDSGIATQMDD